MQAFLFFILVFNSFSYAQSNDDEEILTQPQQSSEPLRIQNPPKQEDGFPFREFSLFTEYNHFKDFSFEQFGIKLNLGGTRFSFNYSFALGLNHKGKTVGHIPFGLYFDGLILNAASDSNDSSSNSEDDKDGQEALIVLLIFATMVPEGVEITYDITDRFSIVHAVTWGGVDINVDGANDLLISWGGSLKLAYHTSNFFVAPYLGIKGYYKTKDFGFLAGLNMGWKY